MSRIDEALGRVDSGKPLLPATPLQSAFQPAWPLAPAAEQGERGLGGPEQWRASGTPVGFSTSWSSRLVNSPSSDPALVEQFLRLASTLHKAHRLNGLRSVMVTSATPGDGKTLTAINLALILAGSFNSEVLLIDADLRRPSIPAVLDFSMKAGLSEALSSKTEQKLALLKVAPGLTVLPAGRPISNSIEAVTSERMQQILNEASSRYDWVILDAPPVGITTDARLLTEFVGGTLFVIRAGISQHEDVSRAVTAIGREHILGVVLNGTHAQPETPYYDVPRPQER